MFDATGKTEPIVAEVLPSDGAPEALSSPLPSPSTPPAPNAVTLLRTLAHDVRTTSRNWHPELEDAVHALYPNLALALADVLDRLPILLLRRLVSALFLLGAESGYPAFRNFTFQTSFDPRSPKEVEGVFLELAAALEKIGEPLIERASKFLWALEEEGRLGLRVYERLTKFVESASLRPGQLQIVCDDLVVADERVPLESVFAWADAVHDQVTKGDPSQFLLDAKETIGFVFGAAEAEIGI